MDLVCTSIDQHRYYARDGVGLAGTRSTVQYDRHVVSVQESGQQGLQAGQVDILLAGGGAIHAVIDEPPLRAKEQLIGGCIHLRSFGVETLSRFTIILTWTQVFWLYKGGARGGQTLTATLVGT